MSLFGDSGASAGLSRVVRRAVLELGEDAEGQDALVAHYAAKAADDINRIRKYTPTELNPVEAIYENIAIDLTVAYFSRRGAEGQSNHSENGVARTYSSPATLLSRVTPKASVPDAPVVE